MSDKASISIQVDNPERVYRGGETVSGEVTIEPHAQMDCRGVIVTFGWKTHGKGNSAGQTLAEESVYSGMLAAGRPYRFPFAFTVPNGPATHHGHYLSVDWYIEARIDLAWRFDPKESIDVVVEPDPEQPYNTNRETRVRQPPTQARSGWVVGCSLLFFAPFLLAGMGVLIGGLMSGQLSMVLFGLVFAALPTFMLVQQFRNRIAKKKVGDVSLSLDPESVAPGQTMAANLTYAPKGDVLLNKVSCRFFGRERVVRGSGTNKRTYTHELHSETFELDPGGRRLQPDTPMRQTLQIRVPEDAPFSFEAPANHIEWGLEVHLDIPKWPDYKRIFPVWVTPGAACRVAPEENAASENAVSTNSGAKPPQPSLPWS